MKFSIIVCSKDRAELLCNGLLTLMFQDYDNDDYEIIVVDDGSNDDTESLVMDYMESFDNIRYFYLNREGYNSPAVPRNYGLSKAINEYCCFTDPEILVPKDMLMRHSEIHKNNNSSIVCTRPICLTKEESLDIISFSDWMNNLDQLHEDYPSLGNKELHKQEYNQKNWKDNHFSSFKKDSALSIGGVNENFDKWGFEGIDFVERMIKSGMSLVNISWVYHLWHDAPRDMGLANKQRLEFGVDGCGES